MKIRIGLSLIILTALLSGCSEKDENLPFSGTPFVCHDPTGSDFSKGALALDTLSGDSLDLADTLLAYRASADSTVSLHELAYVNYLIGRHYYAAYEDNMALGQYTLALHQARSADTISVSLITKLHRNIGGIYDYFGRLDSFVNHTKRAIDVLFLADCEPDDNFDVTLFDNLGTGLHQLGDIEGALEALSKGAKICENGDAKYYNCGRLHTLYARALNEVGKQKEARIAISRASEYIHAAEEMDTDDSLYLADIQDVRFLIADNDGDFSTAQSAAELSFAINQTYRSTAVFMGHSYNNLGRYYGSMRDHNRAIDFLHRAMDVYRSNGAFTDVGTCLENLADIALQRGDTTLALQHLTDAQLAYHGVPEKPGLSFALDRNQLKDPILEKARITYLLHADHPGQVPFSSVSKQVERVDSIFNLLQYEVRSEFSKRNTIKELKTFYEGLLDFSLKGWNTHKDSAYLHLGVNCIAKSKAQILRERQRRSFARNRSMGESLNDQRYSFLSNRNSLINTIRQEKNEQKKEKLLEELDELELQIRYLEDSLYYKTSVPLQEQSITPILAELNNEIPSNHMVLDYFVGQDAIYLSTLYRGELSLEKVDVSTETIIHRVNDLQRGLRAPGKWEWENNREWRDSTQQSFLEAAHFLYQHLVFPFTDRHPAVESLTIIQDGPLSYLPFAALITNPPSVENLHQYQEYPFLNKNFTINYEFSAGTWGDRLGDEYSGGSAALLVCPVQEDAIDLPIIGRADPVPLAPLAYAETEIEQIAAQTKSEELRGEKTTELGLGYDLDKYGILHFTGHGLVFPLSIYQSGILLGDGSSLSKMKLLQLPELSSMRLNLEMLVLSACETGFGEISEGEGMISLSRGGAIAGARSVVASHWLVNQNSKVEFFREYYQNLRAGASRSRALQLVKHSFIEGGGDQSHPYHWASFTLTGETAPLDPAFFR